MAFLHAYEGDLKKATRHYRAAIRKPLSPDLIAKIEDFLTYVAGQDREKYQLYYCLGFFNREVKGDELQAKKDFKRFLDNGKPDQFAKERQLVREWLENAKVSRARNG